MNRCQLSKRFQALPAPHPGDRLRLTTGGFADYAALSEHHYRAGRPATATRVLVLRDENPTVADRFRVLHPPKPTASRRGPVGETVAVLVESLPALSCRMRDHALGYRYGSHLPPRERAVLLNAEVRCISRVVVHPTWRGLGLAVRLVRAALDTPTTLYTEALAAMGKVSPFFVKAGMTAYPRPPHAHDARLTAALERVGLRVIDLARLDTLLGSIEKLPPADQAFLCKELHRWHRGYGRRTRDRSIQTALRAAQQKLCSEPVYYVHRSV